MKRLIPVMVVVAAVMASSPAFAGWGYAIRGPAVVVRPAVPVVTYYAPAVTVPAAPVVTPAPVVVPAPPPSPVLTPDALFYPGMVFYPGVTVRGRVVYRPVLPAYGVLVP